jgi:hypothetical protein
VLQKIKKKIKQNKTKQNKKTKRGRADVLIADSQTKGILNLFFFIHPAAASLLCGHEEKLTGNDRSLMSIAVGRWLPSLDCGVPLYRSSLLDAGCSKEPWSSYLQFKRANFSCNFKRGGTLVHLNIARNSFFFFFVLQPKWRV